MNDDAPDGSGGARVRRRRVPLWGEVILMLGVAIVLAILIKALVAQVFYIPSESMEPGLVRNDRILVQKVSYWFGGSPERGDVVVFEDPGGWLQGNDEPEPTGVQGLLSKVGLFPGGGHLVKRVIGVGGDTIVCCDEQGRISVNGEPMDGEAYAPRLEGIPCDGPMPGCEWEAGPVPDGEIFVMGDNRGNSADSTVHLCVGSTDCTADPYVDVELVVGRVLSVIWPREHWDRLGRPDAFDDVPDAS